MSIRQILHRTLSSYGALASSKDLLLTEVSDPRISPSLLVDPLRLMQILGNFVSNSIKFTEKGSIEIKASLLERADNMDTVCFSVKDTGIGIDAAAQKHLFKSFNQASSDISRLYGGTGLGLAISRRLSEMMGGVITVDSTPGVGTTMSVTFKLPISQVMPAEEYRMHEVIFDAPANVKMTEKPLILAVDDHSTNRKLLTRQLSVLDYRVQMASNGQEALDLWRKNNVDLIIVDCNMPGMDGYTMSQTIREMEAQAGRSRIPIIAWTANALPGALAQCQAAGMDDILTKPADLAMLKAMLTQWLGPLAKGEADTENLATLPVNLALLDKIAVSIEDRTEILQDFMMQTQSDIEELSVFLKNNDLKSIALIAHRIKGASQMLGAHEITMASLTMEKAAQSDKPEDMAAAKFALDGALAHLSKYLQLK